MQLLVALIAFSSSAVTFATPRVEFTAAPVVVWRAGSTDQSCGYHDIPDGPARAWRDSEGEVTLVASWATVRASRGPSLTNISKQCDVLWNSSFSGDNSLYSDHEWMLAPWMLSNGSVIAYMHQEYHGWDFGNCTAPRQLQTAQCWMVAMTSTISNDGGRTFYHTAAPPGHLMAAAPY